MEKLLAFFTTVSLLFSYLFGMAAPTVEAPMRITSVDRIVGVEALFCGQGLTADEEYYYSSGSLYHQKSGIGARFLAKWTADGMKRVRTNLDPIPRAYREQYGLGHIGGISLYDGTVYAAVEGTDYSVNFVLLYDAETLQFQKAFNVSCSVLTDGIPWIAVDGERDCAYCTMWGETNQLLRFRLSDFSPLEPLTLSESVCRIQGGEVYDGVLYLSKDVAHETEDILYRVDLTTGEVSEAFRTTMASLDNEAEGVAIIPRADGSLFHILNYDKLLGVNIVHIAQ